MQRTHRQAKRWLWLFRSVGLSVFCVAGWLSMLFIDE